MSPTVTLRGSLWIGRGFNVLTTGEVRLLLLREYYEESRHWSEVPASFKSWPEYEDKADSMRDWSRPS